MADYTVYYFPTRGRAETCRLVLAAVGANWEDVRKSGDDWQKIKPDAPFGQMPFLEVKGKGKVAQGSAIVRYLGREFGMAGGDSFEQAIVDSLICAIDDLGNALVKAYFEKDEEKKKELEAKYKGEILPNMLGRIDKLASGDFLVGSKVTIADIAFFSFFEFQPEGLESYPKLKKISDNVAAIPGVAEWRKKRPESQY